jgi:hypothetical protein
VLERGLLVARQLQQMRTDGVEAVVTGEPLVDRLE